MMDRLPLVQALTAAGLERRGAEDVATALGDAIEATVATKADIYRLENSISALEVSTKAEIAQLAASTKAEIARLENGITALAASAKAEIAQLATSTKTDIAHMESSLHAMELRLTLRLGGLIVAAFSLLFAALRFTGHTP